MDVLLIENPQTPRLDEWAECSHIKYGTNTIFYVISSREGGEQQQSILLSRFNFRSDLPKERASDRRILLAEVRPNSSDVSFMAICDEIGQNVRSNRFFSF